MSSLDEHKVGDGGEHAFTAFLLTQIGALVSLEFGERIAKFDLVPQHAGIVRMLRIDPGLSQRALAERMGMLPSRLVALVDVLEEKGLVERRQDPDDRRTHALHLTEMGWEVAQTISRIGMEVDSEVCAALSTEEKAQLTGFLARIADQQGLTPGVHPGYSYKDRQRPENSSGE